MRAAFPELAADLRLPQLPASKPFFSSVLRISSGEHFLSSEAADCLHRMLFVRHVFIPGVPCLKGLSE